MAKDRRNKTRNKLNLENEAKERRHAAPAASSQKPAPERKAKPKKKRKKLSRDVVIIYWALAIAVLTLLVCAVMGIGAVSDGRFNYQSDSRDPISPIERDVTPIDRQDTAAYYLFGLLGENKSGEAEMLALLCHNKETNALNVLELPTSTYINKGDSWSVDTLGAIYNNPKALDWCELCKKRLYAPEIAEGATATHIECGGPVTSKKGSAIGGMVDVVNEQLGLPVDEFFMLPMEGLEILVDGLGGVDVKLPSAMMLGDINYEEGVQTLKGAAASDYILEVNGADRTARQRQVLGAVLARMQKLDAAQLNDGAIEDLMDSEFPLRSDVSFNDELEYDKLSALITTFKNVALENVRLWMLPGEVNTLVDGRTVFYAHKDAALTLLNEQFNLTGTAITENEMTLPVKDAAVEADTRHGTLGNGVVAEQVGTILDTDME